MTNMTEIPMMIHVLLGVLCFMAGLWVFVNTLYVNESNQRGIRRMSLVVAISMWLAYLIGGYWYVFHYGADKAIIMKGPWPYAHSFFMETKEHIALMLLLLATYLPIAASGRLTPGQPARKVVLWVSGLVVILGLAMEGAGAIISMGVKVGLLSN